MKQTFAVFISTFFAIFKVLQADDTCTTTNLQTIAVCYQKFAPDGYLLLPKLNFQQTFEIKSQIIIDWDGVCKNKEKLNECIGNDLVQKCFDIKSFSSLPFLNSTDAAKVIIADFLKVDYVCQKIFNFTESDALCFSEKLPKSIDKICKRDYSSCETINEFSGCIKKLAYKKCRKYVACFVQKTSTLEKCSYSSCGGCDAISANRSPIKDMCNDDI